MSRGFKNNQNQWHGRKISVILADDGDGSEPELVEICVETFKAGKQKSNTIIISYEEEVEHKGVYGFHTDRSPIATVYEGKK